MNEEIIITSIIDDKIKSLQDLIDIQCRDGNWNYDPYMQGLGNGMLLSRSILDGKDPKFLDAPDKWLKDKHVDAVLKEAHILTDLQKQRVIDLLNILKKKKAGPDYKKALMEIINLAEEISGKRIDTLNQALLTFDFIEPKTPKL